MELWEPGVISQLYLAALLIAVLGVDNVLRVSDRGELETVRQLTIFLLH